MSFRNRKRRDAPERKTLRIAMPGQQPVLDFSRLTAPARTLAHACKGYHEPETLASDAGIAPETFESAFMLPMVTQSFIGYPACSNLAQYGLMQAGVGLLADETTRKWPEFSGASDSGAADAAKALNDEMDRLNVRSLFREMARMCGFFGGGLLYIDTGTAAQDLDKPLAVTPQFIARGSVRRLVPVEPVNVGPLEYNSTNPLAKDYFQVTKWFVSGVGPVHASRFLYFVKTMPPVILRPAYNFFGIPDVQVALDYFLHFTESRESAARLLKKFSLTILKTDVNGLLYGSDDSNVRARIAHLARERDNDGVYAISQEDEDIVQVNTPLSGVTDIVRQGLEMLACVWRYPVVKFLGVSPGGMNATGESDLRSFYDHVTTQRENMFGHNFERFFRIMQLSVLGEIRDDVTYSWPALWELTEKERADLEKVKADTDAVYLDRGVLDAEEVRAALSGDENGRYAGIDPADVPETPEALPALEGERENARQDFAGEVE